MGVLIPADLLLLRSVVAYNPFTGVLADGASATVRIAQSSITGNTTGWDNGGTANVQSYGDNYIDGNGSGNTAPAAIARK